MRKVLFILLILAIPVLLLAAEPVREWTSKDGKTVRAAFDTASDTDPAKVPLIKNGEKYSYPLDKLSKADQDYVTRTRQGRRGLDVGAGRNEEARGLKVVPKNRRFALLIGVNEYPNEVKLLKRLPSAVKDMTDLADALVQYAGFPRENITLMTDDSSEELLPTRTNIEKQIDIIRDNLKPNDLLIVAFSGHGVSIDVSNGKEARPYFCVRDTDLPDIDTLISRDWFFEQIDKCKADRKIFFCDACRVLYTRDDLVQLASRAGQNASIRSLQDPSETWGYNYVLMSSCAKGQISIDTGTNGLFTKYLLEGLRTSEAALRDGDLTAFSWFEYAAKKTESDSEQMIRENPALVIGAEKQKQQTPRIECRGEMSRFVIAKLDRLGPLVVPQEVEDVEVREYQVGKLKIKLQTSGSTLSTEKIRAGKIQLPPIPKKIRELTGEVQGMKDALTRMENGTHEALREAQQAKVDAQAQYEAIKARRDEEWKPLPSALRNNLEQRIKESPTAEPISFKSLRPKNISFSQFIKQVLWGQKTEQARLERVRVESALEVEIQKEINRIKAALADKTGELDLETRKFRQSLVQFLLEQTPGWNKPNEDEKMDYMFLSETIPALLKYPFGWDKDEEKLYSIALALWKERRPCVLERIKKEKQERLEKERIAQEKARAGIVAKPQLVVQTKGVKQIGIGNSIELTILLSNPGTGTVKNVVLTENVPPQLQHETKDSILTYNVGELKPNETRTIILTMTAIRAGKLVNLLTATADPELNVESRFEMEVVAPQLKMTVQGPIRQFLDREGSYKLTISNPGTAPATHVAMRVQLPNGLEFVRTNNCGVYDRQTRTVRWLLEELPAKDSGDVELVVVPTKIGHQTLVYQAFAEKGIADNGQKECLVEGKDALLTPVSDTSDPDLIGEQTTYNNNVINQGTKAGERKTVTINGVEFAFRWCPAGTFMMGSPTSEEGRFDYEKQHSVTFSKGFWIMETEVTVGMFKAFVNDTGYESRGNMPISWIKSIEKQNSFLSWRNPGFTQDDNYPVTCVSWYDAKEFCKWLSKKTEQNIVLPTEKQWEYACRAGSSKAYANNLDDMAWYYYNSGDKAHPVGMKMSNAWGLYDMHGNVWEWSSDYYGSCPTGNVTDPVGSTSGSRVFYRGGSWYTIARGCRSASRSDGLPDARSNLLGFRCAIDP